MSDSESPASVAVVGGGAVGLAAAVALADRGVTVTLYERDELGSGATGQAAGLCYDAYADSIDATLAARSLEVFRDLGVLTERPYVWVAHEDDDHVAAAIREQVDRMAAADRDISLHAPGELASRFPALETAHLAVGAVAHNAGYVDTDAYVAAMARQAADLGVTIRTDTTVSLADETTLTTPTGRHEVDATLLAAGAHTGRLAETVDHTLAIGQYRAQVLVTERVDGSPPLFYDASERFYLRPFGEGLLVGDGTAAYDGDPDAVDRTADSSFLGNSRDCVSMAVGVTPDVARSWAGLCTATPDRDPLVGHCGDGLYVATGWHGHGFMRAPATGEVVAAEILGTGGREQFDPTRFEGDEPIELPAGIVD